jgi:hypothetical protein
LDVLENANLDIAQSRALVNVIGNVLVAH